MARIRTIKPGFFRSISLSRCSRDARVTFQGLWAEADSAGRGIAEPRLLKGSIWPLDDDITVDVVEQHLRELAREHIALYEVDGAPYYQVLNWEKHQAASYRTGDPEHPAPPCTADRAPCTEIGAGREGKGREGSVDARAPMHDAPPAAAVTPDDFPAFWASYPRHTNRAKAETAWKRMTKSDRAAALSALPAHAAAWKREHPDTDRFIPHASTWLNGRRWEDDLRPPRTGHVTSQGVRITGANAV